MTPLWPLFDASVRPLTVAQTKNLEYVYYDVFTSQNSLSAGVNGVNIDINKSVARTDNVIECYQIASSYVDNSSWWYQLGSNQYPQQTKLITRPARIITLLLALID
jgi:hypothetical protein